MSNLNTTTYIKKLVKIIYEKEKQIENLRHTLRSKPSIEISSNQQLCIDPELKSQLQETSTQLKSVNKQLLTMEGRIVELSVGLREQIEKNGKLQQEITHLKDLQKRLRQELEDKNKVIQQYKQQKNKLGSEIKLNLQNEQQLSTLVNQLKEELNLLKQEKVKQKYQAMGLSKELFFCKSQLKKKQNEIKHKQSELNERGTQSQSLTSKFEALLRVSQSRQQQNIQLSQKIIKLQQQNSVLCESKSKMQESQIQLLAEKLKDYKEFALEISHHIQSVYSKYCNKGSLRSYSKLMRQPQTGHNKFEAALNKMTQIQQWMENMMQKVQKTMKEQELQLGTLQNLSMIAQSFEQKLELCDLTERMEKQRLQMLKNQQVLLNKLEKQCQKSYERQRSKVVELGQLKQILKMTKDVNRELMDEVNKNQHVINECRKILVQVIGNKTNPEFKAIKALLNISK